LKVRAGGQVGGQACVIDVRSPLIEEVVEPDDSAVDGVVNMKDGVEWRFMPDGAKVCERRRGGAENFKAKLNWGTGRYDVEPEKTPLAYFKLMMLDSAGMAVILPMISTAMPPGLKEVVEVELFLWIGICIAVGNSKLKNAPPPPPSDDAGRGVDLWRCIRWFLDALPQNSLAFTNA
jgi:hypothetical protein